MRTVDKNNVYLHLVQITWILFGLSGSSDNREANLLVRIIGSLLYIKFIQQFRQFKITGTFIHMNIGKYGLVTLIRITSSPFGVFQENYQRAPTEFRVCELNYRLIFCTNLQLFTSLWDCSSAWCSLILWLPLQVGLCIRVFFKNS